MYILLTLPTFASEYVVVIDPGHGGARYVAQEDERWDPVTGKYLSFYAPGMVFGKYSEDQVVLGLSKRLKEYLDLTQSDAGWKKFQDILKTFTDSGKFERIKFKTAMTRDKSWREGGLGASHPEVNAPFRLYDYPDPKNRAKMLQGRISYANSQRPYLIVSIHLNPAGAGHPGGMGAVLAPGYRTFDTLRLIDLKKKSMELFTRSPWQPGWLITDAGWSKWDAARSDTWVYFHGFRKDKNGRLSSPRGLRQNLFAWRYKDKADWISKARAGGPGPYSKDYEKFQATGAFWDRERSEPEQWRREGGSLGYGGDNHLASDELMRFVQQGVRIQVPGLRHPGAVGPIITPFVSTYTLPTYVNAINAYLEIGHLNIERDRNLVVGHPDAVTRSLAAGVYSLFAGLQTRAGYGPYRPRGKKIEWERYEKYKEGNYFKIVVD